MKAATCVQAFLLVACLPLMAGCGEREDDWYQSSRDVKQLKQERMDEIMGGGASAEEAGKQFGLEYSIEQTHKGFSRSIESEGP